MGARRPLKHAPRVTRVDAVDVLRGLAIVAMIAYHFAFDLRYFGVTHSDFEHARSWLGTRAIIVTAFLALVGVSLSLAGTRDVAFARYLRRTARVAGCALLVSAGSYALFPQTYIYFGVLHCIAVVSLVAWPLRTRPLFAACAGIAVVATGLALADARFDPRALSWIGFMTHKPATEDYVPLFPWAGVVLIGVGIGHWVAARGYAPIAALANAPRWLSLLGRHSLFVYMVHQPLMLALLWLVVASH